MEKEELARNTMSESLPLHFNNIEVHPLRRHVRVLLMLLVVVTYFYYNLSTSSDSEEDESSISASTSYEYEQQQYAASSKPGFAACLLALDDTIRLYEWIAYHFTVLPLSSLVIALDPKSSNESLIEVHYMAQQWIKLGLNITVWHLDESLVRAKLWPDDPKVYDLKGLQTISNFYAKEQVGFFTACTHHFLDRGKEKYLLHTDTDEFLSYNLIDPTENFTHYDDNSMVSWIPKETRADTRKQAIPIRQQAHTALMNNTTILSFIENQERSNASSYFPTSTGCTRIVGVVYGTNTTDQTKDEILMTKKYQMKQKKLGDGFSKVMLDISKISESRGELQQTSTIHNPFPKFCGYNGKWTSGVDFISSILKLSHYIGSLESFMERGSGAGSWINKQNEDVWKGRNQQSSPYTDKVDTSMGRWVDVFLSRVGKDVGEELLFEPLRRRIMSVRQALNITI